MVRFIEDACYKEYIGFDGNCGGQPGRVDLGGEVGRQWLYREKATKIAARAGCNQKGR